MHCRFWYFPQCLFHTTLMSPVCFTSKFVPPSPNWNDISNVKWLLSPSNNVLLIRFFHQSSLSFANPACQCAGLAVFPVVKSKYQSHEYLTTRNENKQSFTVSLSRFATPLNVTTFQPSWFEFVYDSFSALKKGCISSLTHTLLLLFWRSNKRKTQLFSNLSPHCRSHVSGRLNNLQT